MNRSVLTAIVLGSIFISGAAFAQSEAGTSPERAKVIEAKEQLKATRKQLIEDRKNLHEARKEAQGKREERRKKRQEKRAEHARK